MEDDQPRGRLIFRMVIHNHNYGIHKFWVYPTNWILIIIFVIYLIQLDARLLSWWRIRCEAVSWSLLTVLYCVMYCKLTLYRWTLLIKAQTYLHFLPFLSTTFAEVGGPSSWMTPTVYATGSPPWLLVTGWRKEPGHHQHDAWGRPSSTKLIRFKYLIG